MRKYLKENFHFCIFFFILFICFFFFEPKITPDTKSYIITGKNIINNLFSGNFSNFFFSLLEIDILLKIISIMNISIFFQLIGDNAKYFLVILNLFLFFYIFNINCFISEKINPIKDKKILFLIIIFISFFYLPVFLLSFNILTEVYFQCICMIYLRQLYLGNNNLKKLFLLSLISIFINPMGITLIGFTLILFLSKYLRLNINFLILFTIMLMVFVIPFILDYLFKGSYLAGIESGRIKFLEKGNIIYFFLYFDQGDLKWCESYCDFTMIYSSLKSNSNYLDYLLSGLLRIYYFIYPIRPYFSLNHNLLISISMIFIYFGFFLSFLFCKFKSFIPFYFILFFIFFFVITPLSPSFRYQSVLYLMLIPNTAIAYNFIITKIYEKFNN